MLEIVSYTPDCIHNLFCVPKDDGDGHTIVDCSKPLNKSVNQYIKTIAAKFSYNSVDTVVNNLQMADWLSIVDIKDAYRAVSIHSDDIKKQGLVWNLLGKTYIS